MTRPATTEPVVRKGPLRDIAYDRFRRCLFTSDLQPGQFVSQRQLCELLDVPMGAVREALKRLETDGLVTVLAQRGIQVRDVNVRLINEAFQFRLIIEKSAARHFAVAADPRSVEEFERRTRSVIARADRDGGDDALLDDALDVDLALHAAMVDSLENSLITDTYRVLQDKIRLIRMNRRFTRQWVPIGMKEHLDIITALSRRDPDAAEEALERHLKTSWRRSLGAEV